jgi:hypothetical protein
MGYEAGMWGGHLVLVRRKGLVRTALSFHRLRRDRRLKGGLTSSYPGHRLFLFNEDGFLYRSWQTIMKPGFIQELAD